MNIELNWNVLLTMVHMQQVFVTANYYIQDEGRGYEILFVPFSL